MPTNLTETVAMEMAGVEPWPDDAQLFQPYEVEQILLPDNANCLATQAFLKMCNLPFEVQMRWNAEWMSPSGRVPFLKCGKFLIPELEAIAQHCGKKSIKPLGQQNLTDEESCDMHAYISTINNVLYNAELYICWVHESTYREVTYVRNGSVFAWPLSVFQNWSKRSKIIKQLKMFSWYKKTLDEVLKEVENCCYALSERLGQRKYFFGSEPTELDALVFGHIFSIMTIHLPDDNLAKIIKNYDSLVKLAQRIEDTYFKKKNLAESKKVEKSLS